MIHRLKKHILFRYLVAGGVSGTTDIGLLYIANTLLHIHYLIAATLAFCGAFCVSFVLQKFWTFENHSRSKAHMRRQLALYLATSLVGLVLNICFMYVLVSVLHVPVLMSQIFAGLLVACCTFFLSRNIVFKKSVEEELA